MTQQYQQGKGAVVGGVAVDGAGSGLFMGQGHNITGGFLFDLEYKFPEELTSFAGNDINNDGVVNDNDKVLNILGSGFVTPIDSDGTVYTVAKRTADGNYYLYAFHDLPGDMNGDGRVTNFDVAPFGAALHDPPFVKGDAGYRAAADMNKDDVVNNFDVALFGNVLSGGGTVPEPTSLTFAITALLLAGACNFGRLRNLALRHQGG